MAHKPQEKPTPVPPNVPPLAKEKPKLLVPKAVWEPIFFGSPGGIRARAKLSKLPDLREIVLPPGDVEVRLWEGFGLSPLQGIVLKRSGEQWMANWILPVDLVVNASATNAYTKVLAPPQSRWEGLWRRLVENGLLTLPDSSTFKDEQSVLDGVSYVVEINQDKTYRTYEYGNPRYQPWPEARAILALVDTLHQEFNLQG